MMKKLLTILLIGLFCAFNTNALDIVAVNPSTGELNRTNFNASVVTFADVKIVEGNATNAVLTTADKTIYQDSTSLATIATITNTITVIPTIPIYKLTVTNLTSVIAFDISNLNLTDKVATWETFITVATTNVSLAYPSTNLVYYVTTPTLSTTTSNQTLYAVWRAFITGTTTNIFCNQWLSK